MVVVLRAGGMKGKKVCDSAEGGEDYGWGLGVCGEGW